MFRTVLVLLTLSTQLFALAPKCRDNKGRFIAVNNEEVLEWKQTQPEQWHGRAYVKGTVAKVYPHKNGHTHYSLRIGTGRSQTVEIVYNDEFGDIENLRVGVEGEACGDFIVSRKPTSKYPASPDGALVHWVHHSTTAKHPSGFIVVDGEVFGD